MSKSINGSCDRIGAEVRITHITQNDFDGCPCGFELGDKIVSFLSIGADNCNPRAK
jgi:hypothetical protein